MVVGEIPESVDFLVVGAGSGGYTAALEAARRGRQVVLIDRDGDGGLGCCCLNVGCIPSKALIEVADTYARGVDFAAVGVRLIAESFEMSQFQSWKESIIDRLRLGIASLIKSAEIILIEESLTFTGVTRGTVTSNDGRPSRYFEFNDAVIPTGSRRLGPPHLPRNGSSILDSSDLLGLANLPSSVAIVGVGYIGLEIGTALQKLGSSVTIVEVEGQILPTMDHRVVQPVQKRLDALGVRTLLNSRAITYRNGQLELATESEEPLMIAVECVVVAVGRTPNTDSLGLSVLGVRPREDGLLEVGADRRVTAHVAAVGDVTPGPALAHKAIAEERVAAAALCGAPVAFDHATIPIVIFSDPELAAVGSIDGARGDVMRSARVGFQTSGRALMMARDEPGIVYVTTDKASGAIVGMQIVAPHAWELIGEAALAMEMSSTAFDLAETIHPHPTLSVLLADAGRRADESIGNSTMIGAE